MRVFGNEGQDVPFRPEKGSIVECDKGGKIEYQRTSYFERFDDLAAALLANKDIPDMDELWVAIMEVMMSDDVGIGEATDDQKTVNGNTMTVTPGKETSGD